MQRQTLGKRDGRDFPVPAPQGGIRTTPAQWTEGRRWAPARVPFLWNGDVPGGNCLVNPDLPDCLDDWNFGARDPTQLKLTPAGPGCASGSGAVGKRQAGAGACPVVVQPPAGGSPGSGSGSGSGSGPAFPSFISFATGAPSPTCISGCGTLCTGYFCRPNPTGTAPDQRDPNNAPPPVTTPTGGSGSGTDPTPTLPPLTPVVCTPPEVITTGTNCIRNACAPTTLCVLPPATAAPSPNSPSPSPAPRKQYLAVIREINPDFKPRSTFGNCDVDNDDDFYTIQDFGTNHQTKTYKNCEGHDAIEQLAYSPTRGKRAGQYTNGYRVVEKSGGADVFNGKGKHQWCPFDSYFSLDICIIPLSCAHAWERVFKCEGVWLND